MTWNSPEEKLRNARNAVVYVTNILPKTTGETKTKYENILAYWQEKVKYYEEVVACRKENR